MNIQVLMENTGSLPGLVCEHGLSLWIETGGRHLLFDSGQSGAFADNAAAMGVDVSLADGAVLSHGHYDHAGGLLRFLEINDHAPVYVRRHAFEPHFNATGKYIGVDPALEQSHRVVVCDEDRQLFEGVTLYGCSPEPLPYPIDPFGLTAEQNGCRMPDDFVHEQYLMVEEAGRRILFSGCSHRGILNIVDRFRPDILVGGFHFMKLDPENPAHRQRLTKAAQKLLAYPTRYYTCHCTGVAQYDYLKTLMGDRLSYLSTGCRVTL